MLDGETLFKIFAGVVPIIMVAMGYQYQVMRGTQKQVEMLIRLCLETKDVDKDKE